MEPVSNVEGLEVWKKPLSAGKGMAIVFFHRNSSSSVNVIKGNLEPVAPPAVHAGVPVSMTARASAVALDLTGDAMKLKGSNGLCLGALPGLCKCSNPPSPQIGIAVCNASDRTQHWTFDPKTGQVSHRNEHRLMTCT